MASPRELCTGVGTRRCLLPSDIVHDPSAVRALLLVGAPAVESCSAADQQQHCARDRISKRSSKFQNNIVHVSNDRGHGLTAVRYLKKAVGCPELWMFVAMLIALADLCKNKV